MCFTKSSEEPRFLVLTAIVFWSIGFVAGVSSHDFMWFARFGSLIVAVGVVLLSQASILGEDVGSEIFSGETDLSLLDPKHYAQVGEPVPEWVWRHRAARFAVGTLGPVITGIGTIIWGFGDLLNILFHFKP